MFERDPSVGVVLFGLAVIVAFVVVVAAAWTRVFDVLDVPASAQLAIVFLWILAAVK